jgi:hypothetical protein
MYAMHNSGSAQTSGMEAPLFGNAELDGMIELPLLLPVRRAEALVALSRARNESVGQILRRMIDDMLTVGPGQLIDSAQCASV